MLKWVLWIILIAGSFAGMEAWSLLHDTPTLSRAVWELSAAWPPLPFFVGFLVGFLCCHFWWGGITHFDPINKPERSTK